MVHIVEGDYYTIQEVSIDSGIKEVTIRQFLRRHPDLVGVYRFGRCVLLSFTAVDFVKHFICPRS